MRNDWTLTSQSSPGTVTQGHDPRSWNKEKSLHPSPIYFPFLFHFLSFFLVIIFLCSLFFSSYYFFCVFHTPDTFLFFSFFEFRIEFSSRKSHQRSLSSGAFWLCSELANKRGLVLSSLNSLSRVRLVRSSFRLFQHRCLCHREKHMRCLFVWLPKMLWKNISFIFIPVSATIYLSKTESKDVKFSQFFMKFTLIAV